jgi:hypothetical protein
MAHRLARKRLADIGENQIARALKILNAAQTNAPFEASGTGTRFQTQQDRTTACTEYGAVAGVAHESLGAFTADCTTKRSLCRAVSKDFMRSTTTCPLAASSLPEHSSHMLMLLGVQAVLGCRARKEPMKSLHEIARISL